MSIMCMTNAEPHIAVIGGGAAGLYAAGLATSLGARVTLFEHMPRMGTKLMITGKGRCNLTNNCTPQEFLASVISNPKFLYSAIYALPPSKTIEIFEDLGVPLKTERGARVFPVSDRAMDIVTALTRMAQDAEVVHEKVIGISHTEGMVNGVITKKGTYSCDRVILATGGASYPLTGSDGSGYDLARGVGHTVTKLTPSLVPLVSPDPICKQMQGLSLKNVALKILSQGKRIYDDFGEMLFTHFGISGPMVLSASSHMRGVSFSQAVAEIDLKPALTEEALDARLLSDIQKFANKDISNALGALLPQKMILPFLSRVGIEPTRKMHSIKKEERRTIRQTLKAFTVPLSGFRPIKEAIVTAGGVSTSEVDPRTMMSRLVDGLYFAGEILDVDAYTGGFNLQIAFSTAHLAATSAAKL